MESLLEWARGPFFIFAFAFMAFGLLRHVVVTVWEVIRMIRRAGDKVIPYRQVFVTTLKWLVPIGKIKGRFIFSITSIIFHISIIIVPIFLGGHIVLWARGIGISWPAIPNCVANVFTVIAIITALALVIQRISARATRALSRFEDYALPLLIAAPFASGLMVMHSSFNPFSYEVMLFIHVISANLIFILIPITKLSHMALMPGVHLVSEVAWRWPPDAGSKLAVTLGKDKEPL